MKPAMDEVIEVMYERLKDNLAILKMRNSLELLDNYLKRAYDRRTESGGSLGPFSGEKSPV